MGEIASKNAQYIIAANAHNSSPVTHTGNGDEISA